MARFPFGMAVSILPALALHAAPPDARTAAGPTGIAAPREVLLWPQGAPGARGSAAGDRPSLLAYPSGRAGGAAALICPGGAYGLLALEKEGIQVAAWLNSLGISAFVLKYRLAPRYRYPAPILDAKRAMRWIRAHAADYRLDPLRIGVVGFSAGGHLAATLATRYDGGRAAPDDSVDAYPCQPAFQVLVYPVVTMEASFTHRASRRNLLGERPAPELVSLLSNEKHVTAAAPPAFLVHARTDPVVPFRNSEAYQEACRQAGVPVELQAFGFGTHAFGLAGESGPGGPEPAEWPGHCARWLERLGFAAAARQEPRATRGKAGP